MTSPPVQPHTGYFGPELVLLVGLLLVLAGNVAVRATRARVPPSAGAVADDAMLAGMKFYVYGVYHKLPE